MAPKSKVSSSSGAAVVPTTEGDSSRQEAPILGGLKWLSPLFCARRGSPNIMMPTSRAPKCSLTTGLVGGKAPTTGASRIQVSSSSSEEHVDYSGDDHDFGNEPAPRPDTCKFSHIMEEEIKWLLQGGTAPWRYFYHWGYSFYSNRCFSFPSYKYCFNSYLYDISRGCRYY